MKKTMMMRYKSVVMIVFVCLMVRVSMEWEGPRVFKVGDDLGWKVPMDNDTEVYSHWANTNRFHIGDSLSFVYEKESVMEVDKWAYYHCNTSDPMTWFDNGNSTFKLDRPGLFYFVSGSKEHCHSGQRLIVEVMHIHHHHHNMISTTVSMPPSMSPLPSRAISCHYLLIPSTAPFVVALSFIILVY